MTFVEEHEDWCRSAGVGLADLADLRPPAAFDPSDYPEQLRVWHQSRFVERLPQSGTEREKALGTYEFGGLGAGPFLGSDDGLNVTLDELGQVFASNDREVQLIRRMKPFIYVEGGILMVIGPGGAREGWLYCLGLDPDGPICPMATSISQYLYLIRRFTESKLYDYDPTVRRWTSDTSLTWPPTDTPLVFFERRTEIRTTGEFRASLKYPSPSPEMPGSYLDIAPDFIPVNHLAPFE